jgi:hypothetical protein
MDNIHFIDGYNYLLEVFMKDQRLWLGILVIALVFGMMVVGCSDDSTGGGDESKIITVTGITEKTGPAMISVSSSPDDDGMVAMGMGNISGGSVTFALMKDEDIPWTGSGSFYLTLGFASDADEDEDDVIYVYTDGKLLEELGISSEADAGKLPKYDISSAISTIAFNKFVLVDIDE